MITSSLTPFQLKSNPIWNFTYICLVKFFFIQILSFTLFLFIICSFYQNCFWHFTFLLFPQTAFHMGILFYIWEGGKNWGMQQAGWWKKNFPFLDWSNPNHPTLDGRKKASRQGAAMPGIHWPFGTKLVSQWVNMAIVSAWVNKLRSEWMNKLTSKSSE